MPLDSHSRSETLYLDEPLCRLALNEALQLVQECQTLHLSPDVRNCLHQIGLRLTYSLLRAPTSEIDRATNLALHRHHAQHLAQALTRSHPDFQSLSHLPDLR